MNDMGFSDAIALLAWQVELGVDECIADAPVNRYELPAVQPKPAAMAKPAPATAKPDAKGAAPPVPPAAPKVDAVALAERAAAGAATLADLRAAMEAFEHCDLKKGARNLVFSDGMAGARVMVVGEAPGRDEDREGKPFVGAAGQLLDAMFDAIGRGRTREDAGLYITNVLPWRPPQNREPKPDEIAMMKPFLERHIALAEPDVLVIMGNVSAQALLGKRGITRLRGDWTEACGKPALPMFHPAYLLRNPAAKREAWADLLSLKSRLRA